MNSLAQEPLSRYIHRQDSDRVTGGMLNGSFKYHIVDGNLDSQLSPCQLWKTFPTENN